VERAQVGFAHEPRDTMLAAGLASFAQIEEDARGTVDAVARGEGRTNQTKQPGVLLRAVRNRLVKPRVVAARGHAEDATHRPRAVPVSIRFDEFVR